MPMAIANPEELVGSLFLEAGTRPSGTEAEFSERLDILRALTEDGVRNSWTRSR